MPTILAPPDPRAARAWLEYAESLRGLAGAEYEQAEARAWDFLQAELADLEAEGAAPRGVLG